MVEPALDKGHIDMAACLAKLLLGGGDVLAILLAARIGVVRRGDESNRVPNAVRVHLLERVGQQWMPVAHADVDRQRAPRGNEARAKSVGLPARQLGDRRDAIEQLVMMRDLFNAFGTDAAAAEHVGEEWTDVVASLRAAEGDQQDGVEHAALSYGVESPTCPD